MTDLAPNSTPVRTDLAVASAPDDGARAVPAVPTAAGQAALEAARALARNAAAPATLRAYKATSVDRCRGINPGAGAAGEDQTELDQGERVIDLWLPRRLTKFQRQVASLCGFSRDKSLQELPEGFVVIEHDPGSGSGIWVVATPDRDELPPAFTSREEALAWTKTKAFEQAAAQHRKEAGDDLDADLDRLEHEQGTTAELWSGDRGAELERLELDPETHSERGRSERPERGIEDDEELER
jgi:hypothetical protein